MIAELAPWNRFLGSLNVYKYRLRLHWLAELVPRLHNMKNEDEDDFFWIETNIFVPQLSKGRKITNLFKLNYRRNEDKPKYFFQLSKERRRSICSSTIKGTKMKRSTCSSTSEGTKTKRSICSSTIEGTETKRSI
jgi:hypothetical protein